MKNHRLIFILIFALISCREGNAYERCAFDESLNRNQFYVGPEWYYVSRTKEGGTKQHGNALGVRLGYDRLKRFGWYVGFDALYAYGKLQGHSASKSRLSSHLTDACIEGRFGYTIQQKENYQAAFTPFLGVGYAVDKNHFTSPSPIHLHFKTRFPYGTIGFLSWIHICEQLEAGLNFKIKIPYDTTCKVTHDKENDPVTQKVADRLHYRLDLPITYRISGCPHLALCAIPFFDARNYGSHPNYPFNYIKTNLTSWGLTFELQYRM